MPAVRTVLTLSVSGPLVTGQATPLTGAADATDTVTLCALDPPVPVQVSVYVALADRAPVLCVPLTDSVPAHAPEAVHEVALVEAQVSVEAPPLATLVGLALKDTVGTAADTETVADCDADPPVPVHASVYLVVADNAEVLLEPLIGSDPLQPPDAVQAVALLADQVSAAV
jgi:hypothetical protein